jgi:hypothetical protein
LQQFYAKAAGATAFLQTNKHAPRIGSDEWNALANPDANGSGGYGQGSEDKVDKGHKAGMQTFGESYSGAQDSANGVLAMLEVIMADFASLETETSTGEAEAQEQYERFMHDGKKDVIVKTKKAEMNAEDAKEAAHAVTKAKADLTRTDDQLRAADRYYENLKPKCVDAGNVSFEERAAAREAEIVALKEAVEMLQPHNE